MKNLKSITAVLIIILSVLATFILAQDKKSEEITQLKLIQTPEKFESGNMELEAGKYQFEIVNKDIDTEVAFVLRNEADRESMELSTALPNSLLDNLLKKGESGKTGVVELKPGNYVYGCPLNGTQ